MLFDNLNITAPDVIIIADICTTSRKDQHIIMYSQKLLEVLPHTSLRFALYIIMCLPMRQDV